MKIGVRVHDLGKSDAKTLATKAKEIGFDAVQLVLNKAIEGETGLAGTLSKEKANSFYEAFANEGLEIAMLGAYFNPVHSDKEKVESLILKFKEHLKYMNDFHAGFVGTETGSFNDDKWTYNPLNRTKDAFNTDVKIFKDLAKVAEQNNAKIALEGAYGHCMYNPEALYNLVNAVNSDAIYYIVDIYNYLSYTNYKDHERIFDRCLNLFEDRIVIFHIKDFVVDDENQALKQCCIGKGIMNFDYMLPIIKQKCPNAYLIFEGSKPEDMKFSYDFITNKLK
ncbi:MAG: sugar phosphate isomerase/epimerase [Acholeplasmatales bacterium]|nr:sugar phosphate isomerase/epimerase [Acholeplasmatales bacterium]